MTQIDGLRPGEIVLEHASRAFSVRADRGRTLKELLIGRRRAGGPAPVQALRDVSLHVEPGETVGMVGRNGAGKSSTLRVLAGIVPLNAGRVGCGGRIVSQLELGAGFGRDFSGRENIFLNGAILGMRRAEIGRKFDEIVSFAEVGKFIDTPVKRFSSGMYVRLAFAVAAHLEPELLVVDEVLAVGDAQFQKKCLGKMNDVAKQGRTVLFVSHNMGAVVSLCDRCLLFEGGRLTQDGEVARVASIYQSGLYPSPADSTDLSGFERYGSGQSRFASVSLSYPAADGSRRPFLYTGQDLLVEVSIVGVADVTDLNVALIIYDHAGYRLIDSNTALKDSLLDLKAGEKAHVQFQLLDVLLKPGLYALGLWLGRKGEDVDGITYAATFSVEPDPEKIVYADTFPGVYQCEFSHTLRVVGAESGQAVESSATRG